MKNQQTNNITICIECKHVIFPLTRYNRSVLHVCQASIGHPEVNFVTGQKNINKEWCFAINNDGNCQKFEKCMPTTWEKIKILLFKKF